MALAQTDAQTAVGNEKRGPKRGAGDLSASLNAARQAMNLSKWDSAPFLSRESRVLLAKGPWPFPNFNPRRGWRFGLSHDVELAPYGRTNMLNLHFWRVGQN